MDIIDRTTAVNVGYRLRGAALAEQARTTASLAESELAELKKEGLLGQADIDALKPLIAQVEQAAADRTLAAAESRALTAGQNDAVRELKVLRRKLTHATHRALRTQPALDEFSRGTYHGAGVGALAEDMKRKLTIAENHGAALAKKGGTPKLISTIRAKIEELEAKNAEQELTLATLPEATRTFCEAKGRLYFALKDINDAGATLHADEPEKAARYNLKILYRRAARTKQAEPAPSTPVPVS